MRFVAESLIAYLANLLYVDKSTKLPSAYLYQAVFLLIQAGERCLPRYAFQCPVKAIGPGVVRAGKVLLTPLATSDLHAAVATGVDKCSSHTVVAASN